MTVKLNKRYQVVVMPKRRQDRQDINVRRQYFMQISLQTLLTELLWGLYEDVRVIENKQIRAASPQQCQIRIHCLTGCWISWVSKTKRNQQPLKHKNGWMRSFTDISHWEFVDNDWYSTRSSYTNKMDGNEAMINIHSRGRCDVLQCWHDKRHRITWLHLWHRGLPNDGVWFYQHSFRP